MGTLIPTIKATMKAHGYTPRFRIDPGKVCWAGDGKTWVHGVICTPSPRRMLTANRRRTERSEREFMPTSHQRRGAFHG